MLTSAAQSYELEDEVPRSLVRRCVVGEVAAWRELHRRYYPVAAAFLRKLGVRERDVDDAAQEVFIELFRSLGKYRGEAELTTWMYRICVTHASRHHRRWRLLTRLSDLFAGEGEPNRLGTDADALDARRTLEQALGMMSDGERLVFVLFELEGLPGAQVAEIAACPLNTVWRRLHEARKKLRAVLGPQGKDDPS